MLSYGVVPIITGAIQSEEMSFDSKPGKVHARRDRFIWDLRRFLQGCAAFMIDAADAGRVLTVANRLHKNPRGGTFCDATRQMF
jgi:hypothetical protein